MRLDKFLTETGRAASRSEAKQLIKQKRITINGETAERPETALEPSKDVICFNGEPVSYEAFEYYMLNKPAGVITATEDKRQKTVLDLITEPHRNDLFPVGRLDKDTEGLLLITNDGELAHHLLSPKKHVGKCYFAKVQGDINENHIPLFKKGFMIDGDTMVRPSELVIKKSFDGAFTEVELTIYEGKFHQVKRMFETVGGRVCCLKRLTFGTLILDEALMPGGYRKLTDTEKELLKYGNARKQSRTE